MTKKLALAISMLILAALGCNLGTPPIVPTVLPTFGIPASQTPYIFPTLAPAGTLAGFPSLPTLSGGDTNSGGGTCALPSGWVRYAVQYGDSVSSIASRTGTTTDLLVSANCLATPDVIEIGQVLFVPRPPVYVPTSTRVPGVTPFGLSVSPATGAGALYDVTNVITIQAFSVTVGVRVVFYYSLTGSGGYYYFGEGVIVNGGAQYQFDTSRMPLNTVWYVTAVAQNAAGQSVQYGTQVLLRRYVGQIPTVFPTAAPSTTPPTPNPPTARPIAPEIGALGISPAEVTTTNGSLQYRVRPGSALISLSSVRGANRVRFFLYPPSGSPALIGEVQNPADGSPVIYNWNVTCAVANGRLLAQAISASGQSTASDTLDVVCSG